MDPSQVAKQIQKLLSRLIFDKNGIKINVVPNDYNLDYSNEFPSYKKYIINVHVNPYKFNDVNDEFDQSYYDFMINVDDVVDDNVKYLGIEIEEIAIKYVIDDQDKFILMVEDIIYNKWPEVEREYRIGIGTILTDESELIEVSMRQRGPRFPEFHIFIGTKLTEYYLTSYPKGRRIYEVMWNAVHEILPISEMFVELV